MSNLKSEIARLAEDFAAAVLAAIRTASLEEILSETSRPRRSTGASRAPRESGRRVRRSAADIASTVDAIESLLQKNPAGLRAEQIRAELGLQAKELPRPLAEGLSQKRFTKEGQKRATTYFAGGGGGGGGGAKKGRGRGKSRGA